MTTTNLQLRQALFFVLAAAILAAGCSDSTGPTTEQGSDRTSVATPGADSTSRMPGSPEVGTMKPTAQAQAAFVWGTSGPLINFPGTCFTYGVGPTATATLSTTVPHPGARNFRAGAERDVVYFRTYLYWAATAEISALQQMHVSLGGLPTGLITSSRWYWRYAFDPHPTLFAPPDWIDYQLPGGTTFQQTGERFFSLRYRGYYTMVTEVYWQAREGYRAATWRGVTNTCRF